MKHVISLKPISAMYVSPQRQKRIRAEKFSALPFHSLKLCSSPPQNYDSLIDEDNMSIPVSDNLCRWLLRNNLQGFLKVVEAEPHLHVEALLEEIDVSKITNKKVRVALEMRREGFDAVKQVTEEGLRSYFGEYSPFAKTYQT